MVEFRLYYDDMGKVLCYTCEQLEGNYVVIDAQRYAEGRTDLRIVDGEITNLNDYMIISKLVKSDTGTKCEVTDVCILTDDKLAQCWEVKINEYRNR